MCPFGTGTELRRQVFVRFLWVDSSISIELSCGATSPFQNAARFYFLPHGLLDRRNREKHDIRSKSRVQTWFNLNHFSEEQM